MHAALLCEAWLHASMLLELPGPPMTSCEYRQVALLQMMGTDLLIALAMIVVWELPLVCPAVFLLVFGFIDGIFWTSNLTKIPLGGWFAVTVASVVCLFSYIWYLGTSLKRQYAADHVVSPI